MLLDDLTPQQQAQLDVAERLGKQACRLHPDQVGILTPMKIDRLAEANAKHYITHKEYPRQQDYIQMLGLFIRVFVDAYAAYLRTYK